MTGPITGSGTYVPTTTTTTPPPSTDGTPGTTGATTLEAAKLLEAMMALARSLDKGGGGTGDGVTTGSGAPAIDGVRIDFSPEDMAAALLVLQGKTQEAQLKTAKSGLDINQKKILDKNAQAMQKINDWITKCQEAAAKQKSGGILGWFSKIASFVGSLIAVAAAAVATAATGGAAAPLLALAVVGAVGAGLSLASQISQANGGPPLELSHWMAKGMTLALQALGVPEKEAEAAGKMMAGAAALMFCPALVAMDPALVGNMVGGFATLVGADENQAAIVAATFTLVTSLAISIGITVASGGMGSIDTVSRIANIAIKAGQISSAVAGVAAGGAMIGKGVLGMQSAELQRDADLSLSDKKKIDAIIAKLQKQMEDDRDQIKKVLDEIMEGVNIVSKMISGASESRGQIAANLGGKGATV